MGLLADVFSGESKRKNAMNRFKKKIMMLSLVGASVLSPMKAFNQAPEKDDVAGHKIELVQDNVSQKIQADSTIKFDDYRLQRASDRMCKTKTGKSVLTEMAALNIGVQISSEVPENLGGFYSPAQRKILIRSDVGDDMIASILVHEGTHSIQDRKNGCRLGPALTMKTYFTLNKAMEADAMKNQLFAAAELKDLGDASVYKAFKKEHPKLVEEYEVLKKENPNNPDAVARGTMLAYYKNHTYIRDFYEGQYVKAFETFNKYAKKDNVAGCFQLKLSEAEIIKRVCQLNGHHYMTDADSTVLQSSQCNYVQKNTYKRLEKVAENFAQKTVNDPLGKPDMSYKEFYVVDSKGNVISEPEKTTPTKEPSVKNPSVKEPIGNPVQDPANKGNEQPATKPKRIRRGGRRRDDDLESDPILARLAKAGAGR